MAYHLRTGRPWRSALLPAALLLLSFLAPGVPPARAEGTPPNPLAPLVEQVLQAYGGPDKLSSVSSYRMSGTVRALVRGVEGPLVRTFERPGKLRVEMGYPGGGETRILDGERGWRTGRDGAVIPVQGFLVLSMALQAARADLPWLLRERLGELAPIVLPGAAEPRIGGFGIDLGGGMALQLFLDPSSGRIVRSLGFLDVPGMKTHFETIFSDFREVDGVFFPFHEETFASGVHTGSVTIDRVEVNPDLPAKSFRP